MLYEDFQLVMNEVIELSVKVRRRRSGRSCKNMTNVPPV